MWNTEERALVVCIELARSAKDLKAWWRRHNAVIRLLPEPHKSRVIAAKDKRKSELAA